MKIGALVSSVTQAFGGGSRKPRPVFVIGCGRSGTHLLARALAAHPLVRATIEAEPMFGLSTAMALDPRLEQVLLEDLARCYQMELRRRRPAIYLDKSHPNIWIAEKLKDRFPEARFIGIQRNVFATVASMLKHRGVLQWHERWKEFPLPNRFLGIDAETAAVYEQFPLVVKCALRWAAHRNRLAALERTLDEDLLLLQFEQLSNDPAASMGLLQRFLGLEQPFPKPEIDRAPLTKWRGELSDEEVAQIRKVIGEEIRPGGAG
jgi:hypothetical protein